MMCGGWGRIHKSQSMEMRDAEKENRVPICIACNHEVRSIIQTQYEYIDWSYSKNSKSYVKGGYDGDSEKPVHDCKEKGCACEYQTWDFLDENSKCDLGVAF